MKEQRCLRGRRAVPGIAQGRIRLLNEDLGSLLAGYVPGSPEQETEKFYAARCAAIAETERLRREAGPDVSQEEASILETRGLILGDSFFEAQVLELIQKSRIPAPAAVLQAGGGMAEQIADLEDAYLKERAQDIRNAAREIARRLLGVKYLEAHPSEAVILCGEEIDPSAIVGHTYANIAGLIIGSASVTSHTVIAARSKGIPTVVDIRGGLEENARAILDADEGTVILNPGEAVCGEYRRKMQAARERGERLLAAARKPAVAGDGTRVTVAANIGGPHDLDGAEQYGYEGVGLFRTEFLFMGRDALPGEEEQFEAYRYAIEKCGRYPCVIRTMDIGGDKPLTYLEIPEEKNPFLGWRAIRISLERTDLFLTQIRAILRAGVYGNAAVMLPMISGIEEIREAKRLIRESAESLEKEGIPFAQNVPVGIMVETPAAVIMAPAFAEECDFFSIGTNDLTQYTLAVDRGNAKVASLYRFFHPAVLQSIRRVIEAAHAKHRKVGVCGEMAGDPQAAKLLCALGIDELSMSLPSIPEVKEAICGFVPDRAAAEKVLSLESVRETEEFVGRL